MLEFKGAKEMQLMYIHIMLKPILALVAGLVVVLIPKLERYAVGAYLITIGVLGLLGR